MRPRVPATATRHRELSFRFHSKNGALKSGFGESPKRHASCVRSPIPTCAVLHPERLHFVTTS